MERIDLGRGIKVAPVCLGAMNFGTTTDKKSSYAVLDAYIERGGNFIDTSNNYAHWAGTGDESETLLGEYLKERKNRDKLVIATKVGFDRHGEGAGLKKEQIEYWIDESLRKLGCDYIDIYYAHTDDANTPLEETMSAFDKLVRKGKVKMLGGSNYDTWRFERANNVARDINGYPFEIMQQRYAYLYAKPECAPKYAFNEYVTRERLRYLAANNVPLVAYSCLARGGFENPERLPADLIAGERLEFARNMAKEKGVSTSALIVAYYANVYRIGGPRIIPLFSSSSPEHFIENLGGLDISLTDEELAALKNA